MSAQCVVNVVDDISTDIWCSLTHNDMFTCENRVISAQKEGNLLKTVSFKDSVNSFGDVCCESAGILKGNYLERFSQMGTENVLYNEMKEIIQCYE